MRENMWNLVKYAVHICAAYARSGIFFCIFPAYAISSDGRIIIMIINRPILHSLDIFNFNLFNV